MAIAAHTPDILAKARNSDREFDQLMREVDRFGSDVHLVRIISKGVNTAYDLGYFSGYTAAQSSIREALGIPERD